MGAGQEEPQFDPEEWENNKGMAFPRSQIKKVVYRDLPERAPEVVEFLEEMSLDT